MHPKKSFFVFVEIDGKRFYSQLAKAVVERDADGSLPAIGLAMSLAEFQNLVVKVMEEDQKNDR